MNHFGRVLLILILPVLFAACGGQAAPPASSEQPAAEAPAAAEPTAPSEAEPTAAETEPTAASEAEVAEAGAFPVTLEHKYGSTEITEKPERIVTVGLTEQDALLALGIVPVGTTEWFGEYPGAIWPWAQEALGEADIVPDPRTGAPLCIPFGLCADAAAPVPVLTG